MTFADTALYLGIKQICFGGCGLSATRHRVGVIDPFNVIHFAERRMTKAGLRRFLLLAARRNRLNDPGYLNSPRYDHLYIYLDSRAADDLAGRLGVRFPIHLSRNDRLATLTAARKAGVPLSVAHPAIYQWAQRGYSL